MIYFAVTVILILAAGMIYFALSKKFVPFKTDGDKRKRLDLTNYELTFEDDFNGTEPDGRVWSGEGKPAVRRGGFWDDSCISVRDSNLVIDIVYRENGSLGAGWYTGAVRTEPTASNKGFLQKYGYFETRCRVPKIKGAWAAFWLMPQGNFDGCDENSGRDGSEVDVFESMYCFSPFYPMKNSVTHAVHIGGYGDGLKSIGSPNFYYKDLYDTYHTYGVEWDENGYVFYIDGVESWRTSETVKNGNRYNNVSHTPEYILLSCETAGADRDGKVYPGKEFDQKGKLKRAWNGNPNKNDRNQTYSFCVDYVRVYKKK